MFKTILDIGTEQAHRRGVIFPHHLEESFASVFVALSHRLSQHLCASEMLISKITMAGRGTKASFLNRILFLKGLTCIAFTRPPPVYKKGVVVR